MRSAINKNTKEDKLKFQVTTNIGYTQKSMSILKRKHNKEINWHQIEPKQDKLNFAAEKTMIHCPKIKTKFSFLRTIIF